MRECVVIWPADGQVQNGGTHRAPEKEGIANTPTCLVADLPGLTKLRSGVVPRGSISSKLRWGALTILPKETEKTMMWPGWSVTSLNPPVMFAEGGARESHGSSAKFALGNRKHADLSQSLWSRSEPAEQKHKNDPRKGETSGEGMADP